jgi:hypothetical protein
MKRAMRDGRNAGKKLSHFTGDRFEAYDSPGFDGFDDGLGANG